MDFVIRRHMLLKEERKWLTLCIGGFRGQLFSPAGRGDSHGPCIEMDAGGERDVIVSFCPNINFQSDIRWYILTSRVSTAPLTSSVWTRSKHVGSIYSSGYAAPFHFLSQKVREHWPLECSPPPLNNSWHWLVFFLPLFFSLVCCFFFFSGQHTWLCCGRLLFI